MSIPPMTDLDRAFCAVLLMGHVLEAEIDRRADAARRELEQLAEESTDGTEETS